jgi:hypothetical protein
LGLPLAVAGVVKGGYDLAPWRCSRKFNRRNPHAEELRDHRLVQPLRYYYAQRTIDGRITLGGRGVPYRLTNPICAANERDAGVFKRLCETLQEAFPAASQARITHHWGGPLAVPRDWCMRTTFDRKTRLGFVGAFGGHGGRREHLPPDHARPDPEPQHGSDIASVGGTPHPELGT